MNVLVTGGTGVIGAHVARRLLAAGEHVVLTSATGNRSLLGPVDVPLHVLDVRDADAHAALLGGVDVVVHLAAFLPKQCDASSVDAVAVNVGATAALYEAAAAAGVGRFVYGSSKSAYGPEPVGDPISEDSPTRPLSMYDATKLGGEHVLNARARLGGPSVVSLRFATIYANGKQGRHGGSSLPSTLIADSLAGNHSVIASGGDQVDDLIWVGDAAEGIIRAASADGPLRSLYNIGTGVGFTLRDWAARVVAACPGASVDVGPGLRPMGPDLTYGVLDVERAREDLGFLADADPARGVRLFAEAQAELHGTSLSAG
jgi:UDP-glucose 4-epimerase